jgi:hypothetical protein
VVVGAAVLGDPHPAGEHLDRHAARAAQPQEIVAFQPKNHAPMLGGGAIPQQRHVPYTVPITVDRAKHC